MTDKKEGNACHFCGQELPPADGVSIFGMYDMHLFHRYDGSTVDEVIANWISHISKPIPASIDGVHVDDMGPTFLCPARVTVNGKDIRSVGDMVLVRTGRMPDLEELKKYREALLADPDIPRLLAEKRRT